jgi:nucleoid-associated protein YgaU
MAKSIPPFLKYTKPTPQSDERLISHLFVAGEAIDDLAHHYWGDRTLWRDIADRNNILDVRQIQPGTILLIPERPLEEGAFESE